MDERICTGHEYALFWASVPLSQAPLSCWRGSRRRKTRISRARNAFDQQKTSRKARDLRFAAFSIFICRRKDREASLIEPKSQVKRNAAPTQKFCSKTRNAHRLPPQRDGRRGAHHIYPVFPALRLAYHDVHAPSHRLAEPNAAGPVEIQHCREGRGIPLRRRALLFGPRRPLRRAPCRYRGEVEFPTGHYHGITATLDPALAPDSFVLHFAGCRRPPQRAGGEVLFADSECFCLAFVGARVEHIF